MLSLTLSSNFLETDYVFFFFVSSCLFVLFVFEEDFPYKFVGFSAFWELPPVRLYSDVSKTLPRKEVVSF